MRGMAAYNKMYQRSINENEAFWADMAHQQLTFSQDFTSVRDGGFEEGDVRWFSGGKLNVSYNCIDRHVESECCRFPSFPFLDPLFAGEYSPAAELWRDHAFVVAFFPVCAQENFRRKKHSCLQVDGLTFPQQLEQTSYPHTTLVLSLSLSLPPSPGQQYHRNVRKSHND